MDIEIIKKHINDKFNNLESKIDILALESITTENKEQPYGYTINQLLEKIRKLNKEMANVYMAGFFDGEGYIGTHNQGSTLRISIGSTNLEILIKIKKEFGGYINPTKKVENRMTSWNWNITDRNSLKIFLNKIYPYSSVKKQQIEYGLKFLELTSDSRLGYGNKMPSEEQKIRQFFSDKLKEMKRTELSHEELNLFEEEIKNIDKDKNQSNLLDY